MSDAGNYPRQKERFLWVIDTSVHSASSPQGCKKQTVPPTADRNVSNRAPSVSETRQWHQEFNYRSNFMMNDSHNNPMSLLWTGGGGQVAQWKVFLSPNLRWHFNCFKIQHNMWWYLDKLNFTALEISSTSNSPWWGILQISLCAEKDGGGKELGMVPPGLSPQALL